MFLLFCYGIKWRSFDWIIAHEFFWSVRITDVVFFSKKIQGHGYQSKETFIADVQLIYDNSVRYNGKDHGFTATARKMLDVCMAAMSEVNCWCHFKAKKLLSCYYALFHMYFIIIFMYLHLCNLCLVIDP